MRLAVCSPEAKGKDYRSFDLIILCLSLVSVSFSFTEVREKRPARLPEQQKRKRGMDEVGGGDETNFPRNKSKEQQLIAFCLV